MQTTMDPPRVGGVRLVSGTGKGKPQTVGIMAGRVKRRASARRNRLIQTKPDQAELTTRDDRDRTMSKANMSERVLHLS